MPSLQSIGDFITQNVDDVHCFETGFLRAMERLDALETNDRNKKILLPVGFTWST